MTDHLSATFAALADPTRRDIIAALKGGDKTVNELVTISRLTQPAVSKHLKVLEAAHLIKRSRVARTRPCSIDPTALKAAADWIDTYREHWLSAFDAMEKIIAGIKEGTTDDGSFGDDPKHS